ncbi:MAG: aminotransferase class V-fold PLP-dependent enzyme [Anaerolineaceae bacterium]|nr:aminotransferase class V-fold PLP-dependent enzyme [Anaerolineaceae bacterium]
MNAIYLDNAATSWPKPECVPAAITEAIINYGGNPGRGGHKLALAAGELLYEVRDRTAEFFGCSDAFRVSFTENITMALNLALCGFLRSGDHVLISPMEHNAVMRPLTAMGIDFTVLPGEENGKVLLSGISSLIRENTKLIIICHESNVNGVVQPLREIGKIAHDNGIFLLADCAQSAGHLPIDIESDHIDFLCFTGHKGLFGPTGTGGLIFGSRVDTEKIEPLIRGGTGSLSESFEQPAFLPDRFESGTQNVCGLAGLNAGIQWIENQGMEKLAEKGRRLTNLLREGLSVIPGIRCFSGEGQVLSITIDNTDNGTAAAELEERWGIMTRIGLHCAPLAHRTLGTFPNGTIRFAFSPFNTEAEVNTCIQACRTLSEEACKKK